MIEGDVIYILIFGLLYFIGVPLTTLIHEIGHAIGLVFSTKDGVAKVYLGDFSDSNKRSFKLGRIHFHVTWGMSGFCRFGNVKSMTTSQKIIFMIGGPLISACVAVILYFFLSLPVNRYYLITGLFWMNIIQFVVTIIPIVYPKWWGPYAGYPSDGYQIFKTLKH